MIALIDLITQTDADDLAAALEGHKLVKAVERDGYKHELMFRVDEFRRILADKGLIQFYGPMATREKDCTTKKRAIRSQWTPWAYRVDRGEGHLQTVDVADVIVK